ncbi:hypothetical protein AbraIFM66950_011690 [Aspergillus brasiliensis]|nr:hypothetical protein AbraIFM66950_011690 [Aspergillus brasiliensis]
MTTLDSILAGRYPAKAHARRVAQRLQADGSSRNGIIYLEAQKTRLIEDNDEAMHFRQRRPFFYLSGCPLPDSSLIYNIDSDKLTLFIPPIDPEDVIWSGLPMSAAEALRLYDVDQVLHTTDVNAALTSIASDGNGKSVAFAIEGQITEGINFNGFLETNTSVLKGAIDNTRVVKDDYEIALLRKANDISAKAHIAAIEASKTATNEREIEAAFIATCIANGAHELFEKRISVAFFPHGLGHYLGMDTHDTGGNPNYADKDTMFKYLRVRGRLPAGSVITVEPGIYFCRFIIEPYLTSPETSKYIDTDVLEKYWNVGGVRIEDNVHVTQQGYENLTTAPKTIEEVEALAT